MMEPRKKEALLANLAMAAFLAAMAGLVVLVAILIDRSGQARDAALLARLSSSEQAGPARRFSDPAFAYLYPMSRGGKRSYAALANIGDRNGMVRVAAFFSPDGRLEAVHIIDSMPAGLPCGQDGWFTEFLGKGREDYPLLLRDLKKPDAVAGASESLMRTSEAFSRMSSAVIFAEAKGGER
jgi:hypothetical protein